MYTHWLALERAAMQLIYVFLAVVAVCLLAVLLARVYSYVFVKVDADTFLVTKRGGSYRVHANQRFFLWPFYEKVVAEVERGRQKVVWELGIGCCTMALSDSRLAFSIEYELSSNHNTVIKIATNELCPYTHMEDCMFTLLYEYEQVFDNPHAAAANLERVMRSGAFQHGYAVHQVKAWILR